MKRAAASACLIGLVAAGCGSGRATVERHLVFVRATAAKNAVVWIADADGAHPRRLARGLSAVVAPDGRSVAIGRSDGMHLVSSDGKRDRRLTSTLLNPQAWSPDGRRIIAGVGKLAVVDVDSGRARVLARGAFFGFGFSPDGRRLVYARAPRETVQGICGARIDLYVVDPGGGSATRLTHDGRSAFPAWGQSRIAFARMPKRLRFDDCFAPGIWTMRPDGTDLRAIVARAPRVLSRAGFYGLQPIAWLKSDRLLVGVRTEWGNEAAVLETSTTRLRRLGLYGDELSRDGRLVLGSGGNEQITISIMRVSDGRRLFVLRGSVCCPDWNR
jgi:tricorn protease-like protein